jgi:hypothetical protein
MMSELEKEFEEAMIISADLCASRVQEAIRAYVDELKQAYRDSRKCGKCGCHICGELKCMSCISDATQESRDINARLTEENERLQSELSALKAKIEGAPKVWVQNGRFGGLALNSDDKDWSEFNVPKQVFLVPVEDK